VGRERAGAQVKDLVKFLDLESSKSGKRNDHQNSEKKKIDLHVPGTERETAHFKTGKVKQMRENTHRLRTSFHQKTASKTGEEKKKAPNGPKKKKRENQKKEEEKEDGGGWSGPSKAINHRKEVTGDSCRSSQKENIKMGKKGNGKKGRGGEQPVHRN